MYYVLMHRATVSEVVGWLQQHPGKHRPRDVAKALDTDVHSASVTLNYLWRRGRIDRDRAVVNEGAWPSYSLYGVDDGVVRPSSDQPAMKGDT